MPLQIGYINNSGRPAIKISLCGAFPGLRSEFEAVIDTGFTGFVSMPLLEAFPLGLPLVGATSIVLADGNTHARYTAICSAFLGQEQRAGIVILEPSSQDLLVGMEFVKNFQKTLVVCEDRKIVVLIDNRDMEEFLDRAVAAAQEMRSQAAAPPPDSTPPVRDSPPDS